MTAGEWVLSVLAALTVIGGVIGWMTYMAVVAGKTLQKVDGIGEDMREVREDVDKHDCRIGNLERSRLHAS